MYGSDLFTYIVDLFNKASNEVGAVFAALSVFQELTWAIGGITIVMGLGIYLTLQGRFLQIKALPESIAYIIRTEQQEYSKTEISPVKAFFASLGGSIGVSNLVTISLVVQKGGPGAVFWMWIVAFFGVMLKYSEIYLGLAFRVETDDGGHVGGPMYFLQHAFPKFKFISYLMAILMCCYSTEVFMFNVIKTNLVQNFALGGNLVTIALLVLIFFGVRRGLKGVGTINEIAIPVFVVVFFGATFWILIKNYHILGDIFGSIFYYAFTPHAAIGAFAGCSLLATISNGIAGSCYSSDIAIGYESIMHSAAKVRDFKQQARLSILNIFLDNFIVSTCTALIVLITGVWSSGFEASIMLQRALEQYFPYMDIIMPIAIFFLAYMTIISYFQAGVECAKFIFPKYGKNLFYMFSGTVFVFFSFKGTSEAIILMYACGAALMLINSIGIIKLRKYIAL